MLIGNTPMFSNTYVFQTAPPKPRPIVSQMLAAAAPDIPRLNNNPAKMVPIPATITSGSNASEIGLPFNMRCMSKAPIVEQNPATIAAEPAVFTRQLFCGRRTSDLFKAVHGGYSYQSAIRVSASSRKEMRGWSEFWRKNGVSSTKK